MPCFLRRCRNFVNPIRADAADVRRFCLLGMHSADSGLVSADRFTAAVRKKQATIAEVASGSVVIRNSIRFRGIRRPIFFGDGSATSSARDVDFVFTGRDVCAMVRLFCAWGLMVGCLFASDQHRTPFSIASVDRQSDVGAVSLESEATPATYGMVSGGSPNLYFAASHSGCSSFGSCQPCYCDVVPSWTVRTGAVFFRRSAPDDRVVSSTASGARPMNAGDFNFHANEGFEIDAIKHGALGCWDLEYRFLSVNDFRDRETLSATPSYQLATASPFSLPGTPATTALYTSELTNMEVNLQRTLDGDRSWMTVVAGFRYVQVQEQLSARFIDAVSPALNSQFESNTRNNLFGMQLGTDMTFAESCRYSIEADIRAGIFGNDASSGSAISAPGGVATTGSGSEVAFLGEIGLTGKYRLTDNLSFYTRYQVMWINNLASASDQVTDFSLSNGIDMDSDAFFHGATLGLEFTF